MIFFYDYKIKGNYKKNIFIEFGDVKKANGKY